MKPYEFSFHIVGVAEDLLKAEWLHDRIGDYVENLGLICEVTAVGEMARASVIPDSPLDALLKDGER